MKKILGLSIIIYFFSCGVKTKQTVSQKKLHRYFSYMNSIYERDEIFSEKTDGILLNRSTNDTAGNYILEKFYNKSKSRLLLAHYQEKQSDTSISERYYYKNNSFYFMAVFLEKEIKSDTVIESRLIFVPEEKMDSIWNNQELSAKRAKKYINEFLKSKNSQ
ncbi:MAG: hypothetical protein AAF688_05385 [Bacteroidota bacterium]